MTEEPDEMDEFLELVGEEYEESVELVYIGSGIDADLLDGVVANYYISSPTIRMFYGTSDSGG